MADQTTIATGAETEDGFVADRQRFWDGFTRFTMGAVAVVVVLLLLLWIFLVLL